MNTILLKNQVKIVCHGQASLGHASISFSTGLWPGLLLVIRAHWCSLVVPEAVNTRRFFRQSPVLQKILFLGNKPNFPTQRITATSCNGYTYNDFYPQTNNKSKPNPNPKQSQSKPNFSERKKRRAQATRREKQTQSFFLLTSWAIEPIMCERNRFYWRLK